MIHKCDNCDEEFETNTRKKRFCSVTCKLVYRSKKTFPDGSDFIVCKECGVRARQLLQHVEKVHHMTVEDYCAKHNCTRYDLSCEALHKQMSTNISKACHEGRCGWQKDGDNPSHSAACKEGRRSPWSMNYKGYDGLTDEQKRKKISDFANAVAQTRNNNGNNSLTIDYYIARGYTKSEAKKLLKERQTTFTLAKCIKKYGEDKGKEVFTARQEKWQATLKSKPIEEIQRINKKKAASSKFLPSYSKISQTLFDKIYAIIKNEYKDVFYATLKTHLQNTVCNHEYEVILPDGIHRYFLDFYVKDNNKVIEFDGDYWHSEKRGNQTRDKLREDSLRKLGFDNILHVKEQDYKANPDKVVQECVDFIRK